MAVLVDTQVLLLSDRLARGDQAALAALFERFGGTAFSIALRVLKSRPEAEEVVQETFLEVWRRAAHYSPERAAFGAWVATIARTRAIDRLRTLQSRERTSEAHGKEQLPEAPARPDDTLEGQRNAVRVHSALQQLPPEQREVIELAYFEGLSQQEISERTRTPLGTVKTRARLGSRKLAEMLRAELSAP
jgi:RNA polymerase sigma-70 factor, ECF subfamily